MRIDFAGIDRKLKYKIMTAAIIPRPPALVTTVDRDGRPNAAPYSFFNGFSDDPPIVGLGIARRDSGPKKDTGRNIEETGEFVAHLVSQEMFEGMLVTAAEFPEGVDELALAGFATVASAHVRPPRIADAPVAFECRRYVTVQLRGRARHRARPDRRRAHPRRPLRRRARVHHLGRGGCRSPGSTAPSTRRSASPIAAPCRDPDTFGR